MANSSYVHPTRNMTGVEAEALLKQVVESIWPGKGFVVEPFEVPSTLKGILTWMVHLPGTELDENTRAMSKFMKAPGETFGFIAQFYTSKVYWEFRHPPNGWERWAQDKVQQTIAKELGLPTFEDEGTDDPQKVDPDELRDTYWNFITRNFKEPYSSDDMLWFERCVSCAPEGFRR